jgi:hypothetical protein
MGGDLSGEADSRAASGRWRVAAASVPGSRHLRAGVPCQDANGWALTGEDVLVTVVADGAGMAPLAELGARTATAAALQWLQAWCGRSDPSRLPGESEMAACIEAARVAVLAKAEGCGVDAADLASTLLVAVASNQGVVAAQVGDGAVVVRPEAGELRRLGASSRRGEYLNETSFLTSPHYEEALYVGRWSGTPAAVALLTDGLQTVALRLADGAPHPPFFDPLLRYVATEMDAEAASERLRAFLAGPRLSTRVDDDLTLLLAVRR